MSPLSVPHFSPIGACIRGLWQILQSVQKEVEEPQTLAARISEMARAIVFKFGI